MFYGQQNTNYVTNETGAAHPKTQRFCRNASFSIDAYMKLLLQKIYICGWKMNSVCKALVYKQVRAVRGYV